MHAYMYDACMHVCMMYVCIHIYIYILCIIYIHTYIYIYIQYIHACVCVCMRVCMCVCMSIVTAQFIVILWVKILNKYMRSTHLYPTYHRLVPILHTGSKSFINCNHYYQFMAALDWRGQGIQNNGDNKRGEKGRPRLPEISPNQSLDP